MVNGVSFALYLNKLRRPQIGANLRSSISRHSRHPTRAMTDILVPFDGDLSPTSSCTTAGVLQESLSSGKLASLASAKHCAPEDVYRPNSRCKCTDPCKLRLSACCGTHVPCLRICGCSESEERPCAAAAIRRPRGRGLACRGLAHPDRRPHPQRALLPPVAEGWRVVLYGLCNNTKSVACLAWCRCRMPHRGI